MTWVQGPAAHLQAASTSNSQAFAGSTPAGGLVTVCIAQIFGATAPQNVTSVSDSVDSANLTLVPGTSKLSTGGAARVDIYQRVATNSGTRTITVTFAASCDSCIALNEFDPDLWVVDASNANDGTGTTATPGSVTPTGSAIYLSVLTDVNGVVITPPGGIWTQSQEVESSGTCPISVIWASSSGAQNPSTTLGTSPGDWASSIATFISGAPPTPYLIRSIPNQFSRTYRPGPFKPGGAR